MRQIRVLLTDEQYAFCKQFGRLWLRDIVQALMDSGYDGTVPSHIEDPVKKRRWWFW